MSKFYFVRHGQSEANFDYLVSEPSVQLTELGKMQAKETADLLRDKNIEIILVSPLVRARQTAEIIAEALRIPDDKVVVLEALSERELGDYVGQPRPKNNKNFFYEINEGLGVETQDKLAKRALDAIGEIKNYSENGTVLVVSHGIIGLFIRRLLLGKLPYKDFDWSMKIKNGEVVEMIIND